MDVDYVYAVAPVILFFCLALLATRVITYDLPPGTSAACCCAGAAFRAWLPADSRWCLPSFRSSAALPRWSP